MENERQQELISAYLDGEVTDDEQRAVEALLANSDEARELLAELRGLQTRVRDLPKFSLGAGFSQTVLDEAERTKITGSATRSATAAAAAGNNGDLDETGDDHDLHVFYAEQNRADRAAVMKRRIVWSVLAVAAALLIMVVFPEQEPPNIVRQDREAGAPAAKSEAELAKADQAGQTKASVGKSDQSLAVSASGEATDAEQDDVARVATERKQLQADRAERGSLKSRVESAGALAKDDAPAASAGQAPADALARRAGPVVQPAEAGAGGAAKTLGTGAEDEQLQIAAEFDGVAVFEIDEETFASVNVSSLAGDLDAPTANGQPRFRSVPSDKLADRRTDPFADATEADVAKAKASAERVYWRVLEGTSDEIQLALAELQAAPATHYQAVEMNPQLAARLEGFGRGGRSLARVDANAADDAKRQSAQPVPISPITDAEAPAIEAVGAAPSKPAPAPAPPSATADAATQPDKADAGNNRRKVNGAAAEKTNRDHAISPFPPAPAIAAPAAIETDGLAGTELAKKAAALAQLAQSVARGELRSRQTVQLELQQPLSEAAAHAVNAKTDEEEKKAAKDGVGAENEADNESTKKAATEKRVQLQASRPVPLAEPGDNLPSVQQSKVKDKPAEKTYRVLVVVSVQARK